MDHLIEISTLVNHFSLQETLLLFNINDPKNWDFCDEIRMNLVNLIESMPFKGTTGEFERARNFLSIDTRKFLDSELMNFFEFEFPKPN